MAGKQQQQGVVVECREQSAARRLWRVVRAVLYVLRRGMPSGRKLAMDLHLLLRRGKVAGKALGDLFLAFHGHHRHAAFSSYAAAGGSSFSCGALDPGLAVYEPTRRRREVEFSCSNTPSANGGGGLHLLGAAKRRRRGRDGAAAASSGGYLCYGSYDAADVARVFEMLSCDGDQSLFNDDEPALAPSSTASSAARSPAPPLWPFARSSPRPPPPPPATDDEAQVDRQADEFIRRFYEQLRAQRSAASTPDYHGYAAVSSSPYTTTATTTTTSRRAPRPAVAAGIA